MKDGKKEGFGMLFSFGSLNYIGHYQNDQENGFGIKWGGYFAHIGEYVQEQRCGNGVLITKSGAIVQG